MLPVAPHEEHRDPFWTHFFVDLITASAASFALARPEQEIFACLPAVSA